MGNSPLSPPTSTEVANEQLRITAGRVQEAARQGRCGSETLIRLKLKIVLKMVLNTDSLGNQHFQFAK